MRGLNREIINDFRKLVKIYNENRFDGTPKDTVKLFVDEVGLDRAREVVAAVINCLNFDGRFSDINKKWAHEITSEGGEDFYAPGHDDIHSAHLDQIAHYLRRYEEKTEEMENNKNMYLPDTKDIEDKYEKKVRVTVNPVYADAVAEDKKAQQHKEEIIKKLRKNTAHIVPEEAPSDVKSRKTIYTAVEPIELDESLFEDVSVKKNSIKVVPLTESQSQEISGAYDRLNRLYGIDVEELVYGEDGFMQNQYPNGFPDFAGDVIYSEKYWKEFEQWLKAVKGITLVDKYSDLPESLNEAGPALKPITLKNKRTAIGITDVWDTIYNRLFTRNSKKLADGVKVQVREYEESDENDDEYTLSDELVASSHYNDKQYYGGDQKNGYDSIGVKLENEEQGNLVKAIADELGLDVRTVKLTKEEPFTIAMILDIPENVSQTYFSLYKKPMKESVKLPMDIKDFVPCIEAKLTYNKILDAGKLDEFDKMLENMYPDGLSETELNNILLYEKRFIFDTLNIKE